MEVSYREALTIFDGFDAALQAPSLHPDYIISDASRDLSLKPVFFAHRSGPDFFYHGFHRTAVPGTALFDIQSPYGYGGPIASTAHPEFLAEAWQAYQSWCIQNDVLAEFIRFHPLLENWKYYQGEVGVDRQTVWIDLTVPDLLMTYGSRVRTAVRKGINNNLQVVWEKNESALHAFIGLYYQAMRELNTGRFYLFPETYFTELARWDHTHLALCKYHQEIVAGALFLEQEDFLEYHLSAATDGGNKLCATNLLIHEAAIFGQQRGCRYLHLGGGTDGRPDNSLLFFKSGFSKARSLFKIGKMVHLPGIYQRMRQDWLEKDGQQANRILFYRF